MPEMPEVETVRRGLNQIADGQQIIGIDVNYGKTIEMMWKNSAKL